MDKIYVSLPVTEPLTKWVPGALSLEVKRPGSDADRSPSSCTEINSGGIEYNSTPAYVFMACCLLS
jgi:hypothetical protein